MKLCKIIGKKINFYKLLEEQADYLLQSVKELKLYVETMDFAHADKVKQLEKMADKKRGELVQKLNRTFITPFAREDIYLLSKSLDDILDYYKSTVNEIELYQVGFSKELSPFIQMLEEGSLNIHSAILAMQQDPSSSSKNAIKAKKCENEVEKIYRRSIVELLKSDDIKYIIKMREIYRHLSNCADRIDEVADLICNILMKETS